MKKAFLSFLVAMGIIFSFVSCAQTLDPDVTTDDSGSGSTEEQKLFMFEEEKNPEYDSRTQALDTIFNPDVLGQMVLVFDRSEWNKHLEYCDYDIEHEESVKAKGFYFTKDSKEWFFKDIGFRIRGNTSRRSPQEFSKDENGVCTYGKYIQAHFALDFEEWVDDDTDKKLADSMKGVILKRFKTDPTYSREIYGYNLFRKNGIWIAPRAAYTTLKIQIVDDLDLDKDGDIKEFETVDYGVYGMIEEIKKQFLKERTTEVGGGKLNNNKGHLWKCLWKHQSNGPNFVKDEATSIGEEEVYFDYNDKGEIIKFNNITYDYDYKSNDLEEGKGILLNFMEELNNLPDCTDGNNDEADIATIKEFYTNVMDGDLFLRTYAINVILGMWDDYWIDNNNFYFYFDKEGKAYFIPYDYDNILGINGCKTDAARKNPLEWGNLTDGKHPLIQKILQVPEYMEAYKSYLDLYSNEDSYFDDDKSIAQITNWHKLISKYVNSKDLLYKDTTNEIRDEVADWSDPFVDYKIFTKENKNFFTIRQKIIKSCLNPGSEKLTLTLNAGDGNFITADGNKATVTYEFNAAANLKEIFNANGFKSWQEEFKDGVGNYSYIKEGIYYYPFGFVDSNGIFTTINEADSITLIENTTYNTVYHKYINVTFDLNGGTYDGKSTVQKYVKEDDSISGIFAPEKSGYIFKGWTLEKDGRNTTSSPTEKVYAKWEQSGESVPVYYYSEDESQITFIFRPADFGFNWNIDADYKVRLMSQATSWKYNEYYHLTKNEDGNYSITLNYRDIYEGFSIWQGFKFFVKDSDKWLGPKEYKLMLSTDEIIVDDNPNDPNFKLKLANPKLTLDLNGGNIDGSTDAISFPTNEIQGIPIKYVLEELEYAEPTRDGYIFAGWTDTKDGEDFETYIPYGVATLYARWFEIKECTLTINTGDYLYYPQDDEKIHELQLTFTAGKTLGDVLSEKGYGWSVSGESDENGEYTFNYWINSNTGEFVYIDTLLLDDTNLNANYEYKKYLNYTLDANGGYFYNDETTEDYKVLEGNFSWSTPQREGYSFVGWSLEKTGGSFINNITSEYNNCTFYAIWIKADNFFNLYRIIGDMGGDYDLMPNEDDTVSYTLVYSNEFGNWGGGNGLLNFKIRKDWDWDYSYGCGSVALNGDYTKCVFDGDNITVSGLKDGSTYKITFKYEDESVWVKIAETSAE